MSKEELEMDLPAWFTDELLLMYRSGVSHTFILHGDLNGLVVNPEFEEDPAQPFISLRNFFERIFGEREIVMFYDIASGLRFLTPEMESAFREAAGLGASAGDDAKDPVAAAAATLRAKRDIPREPENCLPLIEKVLRSSKNVAVVIQSVHFIAPQSEGGIALSPSDRTNIERIRNWSQSTSIPKNNNIILLLSDQSAKVSQELRQNGGAVKTILVTKPTKDGRRTFLRAVTSGTPPHREILAAISDLEKRRKKARGQKLALIDEGVENLNRKLDDFPKLFVVPEDFSLDAFTVATQGMNLRQMFEIFIQADKAEKLIDLGFVKSKKQEILNAEYSDLLEIVDPLRGMDDIGGLDYIKSYFARVLDAIRRGEARLVPMGATLMGPPGTGKTALVEALAYEAKYCFVKTKNIRSMWVGASEAKMERLVYALFSLAPAIVMNDEADLNEADRSSPKGDSGVSERLMKMWMELLSNPRIRGQIIVISCTNRPDRLDAALKRSGRSDERILVPMPSVVEREAIFRVMFKRHSVPNKVTSFVPYAGLTDGLSGADIEKIVLSAWSFAFGNGLKEVDDAALKEAINDFIPSASQTEIDWMTLMGLSECSSRRLLPPNIKEIVQGIAARNLVKDLPKILAQIKARKIVNI